MLLHPRKAHVIDDVPSAVVAEPTLAGCCWCDSPYPAARPRHGSSPLEAHQRQCPVNPRRRLHSPPPPASAADRPAHPASPPQLDAAATSSMPPSSTPTLFAVDRAAWALSRRAFAGAVLPTADGCAPLVALLAQTHESVPLPLRGAWRQLGGVAFAWLRREPDHPLAWL